MELILKEDIIGLGYKNDIVNVKSGYGRNYLIPQGTPPPIGEADSHPTSGNRRSI